MIGDELRNYTWRNLMNMAMGEVSDEVDKKQGSIIWDTLSPAITCLSTIIELMRQVYINTFVGTAQGEYLDARVAETGLTRIQATNTIKRVLVYDKNGNLMDLPVGTLITPKGNGTLLYSLNEKEDVGTFKARCSTAGTVGNEYIGECELIGNNNNVGSIIMTELIESARNIETDTELRARHKESTGTKPFGGNIADYRRLVGTELTTVGQMQVYPRTSTDETIIVSVVDNENNLMTEEQLLDIAQKLDPSDYGGEGEGLLPIGHLPVVVTPTEKEMDFEITVTVESGRSVSEMTTQIEEKVTEFTNTIRDNWAKLDTFYNYTVIAYPNQLQGKIAQIDGILTVEVLINDSSSPCEFTESRTTQEFPKLGTITIE